MAGPTITRVVRTEPDTLAHTYVVGEVPTDPSSATATLTLTKADGTAVATDATTVHGSPGVFTYALAGQAALDRYTADWTATFSGSTVTQQDIVEIVGARCFTLRDARSSDPSLADEAKYTEDDLDRARIEVEVEAEQICDRSFIPAYRRAVLDGSGTRDLLLTDAAWAAVGRSMGDVRRIRTVKVAPRYGQTAVVLTDSQLAACYVTGNGLLRRTDGNVWTEGDGNIVVEIEYGLDSPPPDLVRAMYRRLRDRLNWDKSGIPDRASSFSLAEGGTYRLDMPDTYKTGIPDVDATYGRYSRRAEAGTGDGDGSGRPASRTLTYDPQRASMFHGKAY